jgi:hypothetical protein
MPPPPSPSFSPSNLLKRRLSISGINNHTVKARP